VATDSDTGRERWYPSSAWVYTCGWIAAVIITWVHSGKMPLWMRIAIGFVLVVTTPAGSDLFLIRRYWREGGSDTR